MFEYRKEEIISILDHIYKQDGSRENISDIIMDIIGKYTEARHWHKFKSTYISKKAKKELENIIDGLFQQKKIENKFPSKTDIHNAIGKLIHEHMTPKRAIFEVFEKNKSNNSISYEFIKEVLEKCSATCIITNDENGCLMRNRHPHLDHGNFDANKFEIKERYKSKNFRDEKKGEDDIEVEEFSLENFVDIKTFQPKLTA